MFKPFLFFICLIFIVPMALGTDLRSQADYIMASPQEQREYVVKLMELIVSIESQYKYEVSKNGHDHKRFEKYSKLLQKLSSELFLGNAIASPNSCGNKGFARKNTMKSWESFAKAFHDARNAKSNYCMFAGWISRTTMVNGTAICAHPDFINGVGADRNQKCSLPLETLNYPDHDLKDPECAPKNGKRTIQCNPAIFGFKSSARQSMFCVAASDGAHNAALSCMKKALADPAQTGADTKESRLNFLREKLKDPKNKKLFENVQEFAYRTCLCNGTDTKFSSSYHDYIKDHRTCYGMMKMMAETFSCEVKNRPLQDNSIFENLIKFSSNAVLEDGSIIKNLDKASEAKIDAAYKIFRRNMQLETSQEYKRICREEEKKPEVQNTVRCENAVCSGVDGNFKCVLTLMNEKDEKSIKEVTLKKINKTAEGRLVVEGLKENSEKALSCAMSAPAEVVITTPCSAECKPKTQAPAGKKIYTCSVKADATSEAVTKEFELTDKETKLIYNEKECSVSYTQEEVTTQTPDEEPGTEYECTKAVCEKSSGEKEKEKEKNTYSCKMSYNKIGETESKETELLVEGKPTSVEKILKIDNKDVKLSCANVSVSEDIKEEEDTKTDFTLDTKCLEKTCTVKVVPKKENSLDGWTINWSLKGEPKGLKDATKDQLKSDQSDIVNAIAKDMDQPATPEEKPAKNLESITLPRAATTYKACADISKGSEKLGEKCGDVSELGKSKVPVLPPKSFSGPQMTLPQQGPMRGMSNSYRNGMD